MATKPVKDAVLGVETAAETAATGEADAAPVEDTPAEGEQPDAAAEPAEDADEESEGDAPDEPDAGPEDEPEAEADVVVVEASEAPFGWDLVGEDGRRVVRGVPRSEAEAVKARIAANGVEEELLVVPAAPPVDHLSYPDQG